MSILEKDSAARRVRSDLRGALSRRRRGVAGAISLEVRPGGAVGEGRGAGSGKPTAGTALLAYSRPGAFIERGTLLFEGQDILSLPWEQVRPIRGMKIAYVPQDPGAALNPAIRIGRQI